MIAMRGQWQFYCGIYHGGIALVIKGKTTFEADDEVKCGLYWVGYAQWPKSINMQFDNPHTFNLNTLNTI